MESSTMKNKNNKILLYGVIGFVVVLILGSLLFRKSNTNTDDTTQVLPSSQEVLPTINPSTKVALVADSKKQNVTFTVDNIPSDVTSIEYEMVYEHDLTKRDIAEGAEGTRKEDAAIGTLDVDGKNLTKTLKLGTCSATCTYHLGVETVRLSLKFLGGNTPSMFEKEFSL